MTEIVTFLVTRGTALWMNREGREVPVSHLDNSFLLSLLDRMYSLAVVKQETIVGLYKSQRGHYFQDQAERLRELQWRDFVDPVFSDIEYEAASRRLAWEPKPLTDDRKISALPRGALERYLVGALRDAINCHGPITRENASSAAKRLMGAIRLFNHDQSS